MSLKDKLDLTDDGRIGTTSSSLISGSPTFDEIPFHLDVGRKPALGTYVVVERDDHHVMHYGRVMSGTEENPRADPLRLQQNQAYEVGQKDPRPNDRSPHVTRVMTVEVLGEIQEEGELTVKEPSLLAQTGKAVYELPAQTVPWLLNIPDSPDDGFQIGIIESGNAQVPFILPMAALARHIAWLGKTGVGKSYGMGVAVEEAKRHGIPVVSFDVLADLIPATEDLDGVNLRAGTDFRVPYSVIGLSEFLNFIPNLTRDQSELVALAYDRVFGEALDALDRTGEVDISLDRLLAEINDTAVAFGQAPVGGRAAQRVRAAVSRNSLLTTGTESWLKEIAEKPIVNVFVGHLGQNSRNLVVGAAARMIQALRRKGQIPPLLFVLDEAHLFLPAGHETTPSTHVIREMIRTARHDAIGIMIATQSPSSMDKQVLLTCNTRIVFALDQEDVRLVSGTMGDLPEQMVARIPKQRQGTAIITSGMDIMRHSAPLRIRRRETREGAPTPNLAEETRRWREQKKRS